MTVRIDQIHMTGEAPVYLPTYPEHQRLGVSEEDMLGLVRNIMRERGDCKIIPVVNAVFRVDFPNEYGDNVFIDVTYDKSGHRATYGAKVDPDAGTYRVQCYMD